MGVLLERDKWVEEPRGGWEKDGRAPLSGLGSLRAPEPSLGTGPSSPWSKDLVWGPVCPPPLADTWSIDKALSLGEEGEKENERRGRACGL